MYSALHVDLDGAWIRDAATGAEYLNAREWGSRLRFSKPLGERRDHRRLRHLGAGSADWVVSAVKLKRLEK